MCALHGLLQARIDISRLAAGVHGAIAALLELRYHVTQPALISLLLPVLLQACCNCLACWCIGLRVDASQSVPIRPAWPALRRRRIARYGRPVASARSSAWRLLEKCKHTPKHLPGELALMPPEPAPASSYLPSLSESPGIARSTVSLRRCHASRDACLACSHSSFELPREACQSRPRSGSKSSKLRSG
jgi:hypothetical protein